MGIDQLIIFLFAYDEIEVLVVEALIFSSLDGEQSLICILTALTLRSLSG